MVLMDVDETADFLYISCNILWSSGHLFTFNFTFYVMLSEYQPAQWRNSSAESNSNLIFIIRKIIYFYVVL